MAFLNWGSTVGGGFATPGGKNPSVAGIASTASTTSNSTSDSEDLSSDNDELDFLVRIDAHTHTNMMILAEMTDISVVKGKANFCTSC